MELKGNNRLVVFPGHEKIFEKFDRVEKVCFDIWFQSSGSQSSDPAVPGPVAEWHSMPSNSQKPLTLWHPIIKGKVKKTSESQPR